MAHKATAILEQRWRRAAGLPDWWRGCYCGSLIWCDSASRPLGLPDQSPPPDGPACFFVGPEYLEHVERGMAMMDALAEAAGLPESPEDLRALAESSGRLPSWAVEPLPKPHRSLSLPPGEDLIARLKAAYRVEDMASRWTDLRGGNTLLGKCPLHNEQQGRSFAVWVDSQRWKCFGKCGIGGDVIDLARAAKERGLSLG